MNKKGFILLPIMAGLSLVVTTLLLIVVYKDNQISQLEDLYQESSKMDIDSGRQVVLGNIKDQLFVTNTELDSFGEQTYDTNNGRIGGNSTYETLEDISGIIDEGVSAMENTQLVDKIITNKTTTVERLSDDAPTKTNNIFELDLINFLDTESTSQVDSLAMNDLKLIWGTNISNTSDIYLVMSRIRKGVPIDLTDLSLNLSKKESGVGGQFGTSNTDIDNLATDYIKLDGGTCSNILDSDVPDPSFHWCKEEDIYDILSNSSLDLDNYIYKVFLVFGQVDGSDSKVPFKIYSDSNGSFGVGNLVQADVTLLTSNNLKKRLYFNTSIKNTVMPYILYSLWVKGKIYLENDET